MKLRFLAWSALAASLAAAGCSLLVDFDSLDRSPDGGDGAAIAEAGGSDAGAEASATDDGSSAMGCARYADASFCVDFDQDGSIDTPAWTSTDLSAGTIARTNANVVSPPFAATIDLTDATGGCAYTTLERRFDGTFQSITARLDARPEGAGIFLALISRVTADLGYRVLVSFSAPGSAPYVLDAFLQKKVSSGGNDTFSDVDDQTIAFDATPFGSFHDVTVEYGMSPLSIVVKANGKSVSLATPADFAIHDLIFQIGPYCHDDPMRVTVDDVAVWTTPSP